MNLQNLRPFLNPREIKKTISAWQAKFTCVISPQTTMDPAKQPHQAVSKGEKLLKGVLVGIIAILLVVLALLLYEQTLPPTSTGRTDCFMNIRNFQTGTRAYTNLKPEEAPPTAPVDAAAIYTFMGVPPFQCPSGKSYTVQGRYGDPPGTVFLRCSHPDHAPTPAQSANW